MVETWKREDIDDDDDDDSEVEFDVVEGKKLK